MKMETLIELHACNALFIEIVFKAFFTALALTFVSVAIYDVTTSRRKGDSWKTIVKRYL